MSLRTLLSNCFGDWFEPIEGTKYPLLNVREQAHLQLALEELRQNQVNYGDTDTGRPVVWSGNENSIEMGFKYGVSNDEGERDLIRQRLTEVFENGAPRTFVKPWDAQVRERLQRNIEGRSSVHESSGIGLYLCMLAIARIGWKLSARLNDDAQQIVYTLEYPNDS